jgi:hypothetical protein
VAPAFQRRRLSGVDRAHLSCGASGSEIVASSSRRAADIECTSIEQVERLRRGSPGCSAPAAMRVSPGGVTEARLERLYQEGSAK